MAWARDWKGGNRRGFSLTGPSRFDNSAITGSASVKLATDLVFTSRIVQTIGKGLHGSAGGSGPGIRQANRKRVLRNLNSPTGYFAAFFVSGFTNHSRLPPCSLRTVVLYPLPFTRMRALRSDMAAA